MSSNSQSSEEEDDISPLDYARINGLSRDYLAEPFPAYPLTLPKDFEGGMSDDSHLPQFEFPNCSTDERLSLSKHAAVLLAWVSKAGEQETIASLALSMLRSGESRVKHLDLPLLKTDHEMDCKQFAQRDGFETKLRDVRLPLEMVDDEKDEGLRISSKLWDRGPEMMEELKKERLSVRKDTLFYIQNVIKIEWDKEVEKEVWAGVQKYKKNCALEPVTPPLSPIPSLPEPFEPSSSDPAFQLPILSDPVSLTKEDLDTIEKVIYRQDVPFKVGAAMVEREDASSDTTRNDNLKLGDIYSPLASLDGDNTPPNVESLRRNREQLKVEETLTPPEPTPLSKTVHFNRIVEEMIFNAPSPAHGDSLQSSFFEDAFRDAGQRAMMLAEQETLVPADTTARVAVPILDFSTVDPPWKKFQNQRTVSALLALQKSLIQETLSQQLPKWPVSKSVDTKLKWNPFPHGFAKVALEEDFGNDDEVWNTIVNGPGDDDIVDTSSLTWKPPGLKILKDEEDDDDEIEPAKFGDDYPRDLLYLAKKRKMEMEEEREELGILANLKPANQFYTGPAKLKSMKSAVEPSKVLLGEESGLLGGRFSIAAALDNFQTLRGTKKQKLSESSYFPGPPTKTTAQVSTEVIDMQFPIRTSPNPTVDSLPTPIVHIQAVLPTVIISSSIVRNRALIKQIEIQLPGVKVVERDFTTHNTTAWLPNSVTRSPIASSLAVEADIIVSPSTGLILTTLQKIKQKPLPGQKTKPAIRDRVERVSLKYDRIIILVSEGRSDGSTNGLDESDCLAISEFVGFASGLGTTVVVHYLGGGEEILSKWLVGNILQYRKASACDLLEDETHWELFLRRAGMNAYAAQAIIADLKAPEGVDPTSPTKTGHFGLVAFVEMSQEQRVARFGNICGVKLLERVGAVVDARWA